MMLGNGRWWVIAALAATVGCAGWLYFCAPFSQEDIGFEAMDKPIAVAHVLRARQKHVTVEEYMANDPVWENVKREDPKQSYAYLGRFQFYFFACHSPVLSLCYLPFVQWMGVKNDTVTAYSTFFLLVTLAFLFALVWKAGGVWQALASLLFLLSSLVWLIHVKVAYPGWMPSAALMCFVALCLHTYMQTGNRWTLTGAAIAVGLLYLMGWLGHVFALLLIGLVLTMEGPRSFKRLFLDGALVIAVTLFTTVTVAWCYAQYAGCSFFEIFKSMQDDMMSRFSHGAVEGLHLTLSGKLAFAFKGLFLDSRMPEHLDKCLEGKPAVSAFFGVALAIGSIVAIRDRKPLDRLLLIWMAAVFVFLCTASTYVHRYALLVMPAMAALAARGLIAMGVEIRGSRFRAVFPVYVLLCVLMFLGTVFVTRRDYYTTYVQAKPAGFEIDRGRGHCTVARWLKSHGSPADTLLVLGDPIMFPHTAYLFNFIDAPYPFIYWNNYFRGDAKATQVRDWEREQLLRYQRIVCVFSTVFLGNPQTGVAENDWRPFMAAHPGIKPVLTYSYAGRKPNFFVFEIRRE